jgi:predicted NBD/HSP70 family sugar kinase
MIIGVDIGGTKTLVASFDGDGKIAKELSFATPTDYPEFLSELESTFGNFANLNISKCCVGVPGLLDRKNGVVRSLGNLPWVDQPIGRDIAKIIGLPKVSIENDSKLAGLSEVRALGDTPKRALYLTISTGIGGALVVDGELSTDMIDMEVGKTPLLYQGDLIQWEGFASGHAFVEAFGKVGDEVGDDPIIWQSYALERLGPGLVVACSYLQIDTIIFGGGLGHHSNHFASYLGPYLDERLHSNVVRPSQFKSAKHGKNAVIYGCFEYAKDHH